jgi:hypothetical protein
VTLDKERQSAKQRLEGITIDEEMQIDESDEQLANAPAEIEERLDSSSNVMMERE